ncbi:hypothetical protein ABIC03_007180 [Bradyrhizobium sp. RT6a]|uniref:hypothetical protein n=1 Tax=Bradyrhizobium sp. RT6a TaxID=3156381 RepID=UPI0033942F6C
MNRKSAFGYYSTPLRNPMTQWSGMSADRKIVAVSLWRDGFRGPGGRMIYEKSDTSDWADGPAKHLFFRHLQHAVDHSDGLVRVVMVVRDSSKPARTIDCYPAPNVIMRIASLDTVRLTFRLEQTDPGPLKSAA